MGVESWDADDWLFAALTGDEALVALVGDRVFPDQAPAGTEHPYVIYSLASGRDTNAASLARVTARLVYTVKAVGRGGYTALRPVTRRIEAVLHGRRVVQGGTRLTVSRAGLFRFPTYLDNVRYSHAGALYAAVAQPIT